MIQRGLFLLSLTLLCDFAAAARPHFVLPADGPADTFRIKAIKLAIEQKNDADAAALLDELLAEEGDSLIATEEGGLMSVSTWVGTWPAELKSAAANAYREKFEPTVRTKLDLLRQDPSARAEEFAALARRHPLSASAKDAYALAAERYVHRGDLASSHALYQIALRERWMPDERQRERVEWLREFNENGIVTSSPGTTIPSNPSSASPFSGAIPFDAPWLGRAPAVREPRIFPYAAGGRLYFATPYWVGALKEDGQPAWSTQATLPTAPAPPRLPAGGNGDPRPAVTHPPDYSSPAFLLDTQGRAQIIIARQRASPLPGRENVFALRAYRATDGKPLWTSENQPFLHDLTFVSAPAIAGSYTYAVALNVPAGNEIGGDVGTGLHLVALDTLTGEFLWQTTLGRFSLTVQERGPWGAARPWDGVWELSEPRVAGDAVYVTPNAGLAACAGRFDGKLRWLRTYPASEGDQPPTGREVVAPGRRWRGTPALCGPVMVAAPPDSRAVYGFDIDTGRILWTTIDPDAATLVGQTPTSAIFAAAGISSFDARNGKRAWQWKPPDDHRICGPAVLSGGRILVPTAGHATTLLNAADGSVLHDQPPTLKLRQLLNEPGVKKWLEQIGAGKGFSGL